MWSTNAGRWDESGSLTRHKELYSIKVNSQHKFVWPKFSNLFQTNHLNTTHALLNSTKIWFIQPQIKSICNIFQFMDQCNDKLTIKMYIKIINQNAHYVYENIACFCGLLKALKFKVTIVINTKTTTMTLFATIGHWVEHWRVLMVNLIKPKISHIIF